MCISASVFYFILTVLIIFIIYYFVLLIQAYIKFMKSKKASPYWKTFDSKNNVIYGFVGVVAGVLFFIFMYNGSKTSVPLIRYICWTISSLFFFITMYISAYKIYEDMIQKWAEDNNYRLLKYRPCFFGEGTGGLFSAGRFQHVFKITLEGAQGTIRQAYFILGSYSMFDDPTRVRVEFIN